MSGGYSRPGGTARCHTSERWRCVEDSIGRVVWSGGPCRRGWASRGTQRQTGPRAGGSRWVGLGRQGPSGAAGGEALLEADEVVDVQGRVEVAVGVGIGRGEPLREADEVVHVENGLHRGVVAVGVAGG